MKEFNKQPDPNLSEDSKPVWPQVIKGLSAAREELLLSDTQLKDLVQICEARNQFGISKYGVPLSTHNGRNAIQDAFEETLDLVVYSFQAYMEQKTDKSSDLLIFEELLPSVLESMVICYKAVKFLEEKHGKSN